MGIILLVVMYLIALSVVAVIDHKIGDIKIQMPKIEITKEKFQSTAKEPENIDEEFAKLDSFEIQIPLSGKNHREIPEKINELQHKSGCENQKKIGCTKDSDCNVTNNNGKNVCKSDGSCYCLSGSGLFCQYGPTNYKDPKDMTESERKIFKYKYRNDFTLQDYKNWLMLYKDDPQHLRHNHRENLKILLRGGQLTEKDLPNIRIKPPMDPADYFQKMYQGGKISVHFPEESATGAMLGYNYNNYDEFIPPEKQDQTWVTGIVDLYRQPHKDDAKALNSYLRPEVTVGTERELVGEEYLSSVKNYHNLADIRKIHERKNINESLSTFESPDQNIDIP
jgi:hypothetical protein